MTTPPSSSAVTGPPLPTPSYGAKGSFAVSCSSGTTPIKATPRDCLDVVVKASEYATWNRFCRKCTIDSQPHGGSNATAQSGDGDGDHDSDNGDDGNSGKLQLGTHFTFDVHMNVDEPDSAPGQAIALEVSVLEPIDEDAQDSVFASSASPPPRDADADADAVSRRQPRKGWRIAWRQRPSLLMPGWMLRSERVQEFVEVNGGSETEYHCWETFSGLLAPVVRLAVGKQVEKGFDAWLAGLKGAVEKQGAGSLGK